MNLLKCAENTDFVIIFIFFYIKYLQLRRSYALTYDGI